MNAQKSTGPRTPEGKARSSQNATKLGIYSKNPVLSEEDRQHAEELRRGFLSDYPPTCTTDQVLVEELISSSIRMRYLNRLEADLWDKNEADLDTLGKISRQRTAADRSFHRSLKLLEQNKTQRLKELQNKPNPPQPVESTTRPTPAPIVETCKNKPNPAPVQTEPKLDPADEPSYRAVEQQIMSHGRAAAFREDDPETCYSDDLLELYFDLKVNLPLPDLRRHIQTLTQELAS